MLKSVKNNTQEPYGEYTLDAIQLKKNLKCPGLLFQILQQFENSTQTGFKVPFSGLRRGIGEGLWDFLT